LEVLFVTREYPPFEVGGVAIHTFWLVKHLRKLGVNCVVLSFGDPALSEKDLIFIKPQSSIIKRANCPLTSDAKIPLDILRFTVAAQKLISQRQFDVVHVEEPYVGAMVQFERKISTIHDTSYGELKAMFNDSISFPNLKRAIFYTAMGLALEQLCIASSKTLITPYDHVKEELLDVYRTPENKIHVIRNGLDTSEVDASTDKYQAKRKLGLSPNGLLIFTTAQHIARKRLDTLVKAVKLLHEQGIDGFQVVIAGDGPLRPNVERLVKKCDLTNNITLPGWVPREKLKLYYQAADIFTLTSEYEAGPLTLLEAMSHGNAIVSSRIDGFARLINDGVDGLLYPAGDSKALSYCAKRLIEDDSYRQQVSEAAKVFVRRFDWKIVAEQTLHAYKSMF
jgi:glycosyltransferase involved in cell wall biosynthesis